MTPCPSALVSAADPTPPQVSVIVPAYNSARTIEACLAALARQKTALRFEVILVDTGSDDTTERAERTLPGLRVIRRTLRATPGAARNLGAAHARSDVLAFVDSDASAAETWLDALWAALAPGIDVLCGAIVNGHPESRVGRAEQLLMFNEFLPDSPGGECWFAVSANMAARRAIFERVEGFPDWRGAEDVVFSRRVIAAGGHIHFRPEMRVTHDNRTDVRRFARNQLLLGHYTALARREVGFADTSYAVFVALLPLAPFAKLAKITFRMARRNRRRLLDIGREFPLFALGLLCYSLGLVRGACARRIDGQLVVPEPS